MLDRLLPAVWDVDRLNSWVRSESYRRILLGGPKKTIYWLKRKALIAAHEAGLCEHRKIRVEIACRTCGGTGVWQSYDPDGYSERCNKCNGRGEVKLYFLETRIHGRTCWHTPQHQVPHALYRGLPSWLDCSLETSYDDLWELETDWRPNQSGGDMEPHEVAKAFCEAEAVFSLPEVRRGYGYSVDEVKDIRHYRLFVGRTDLCHVCLEPAPQSINIGMRWQGVQWTERCCDDCWERRQKRGIRVDEPRTPPAALIAHPDIQRWIELHPTEPKPENRNTGNL